MCVRVYPSDTAGQDKGQSYAVNSCIFDANVVTGTTIRPGKSLAAFDETSKWMALCEEGKSTGNSMSTEDAYQAIFQAMILRRVTSKAPTRTPTRSVVPGSRL